MISAERGEEKWIINLATGEQKAVAYESLGDLHDGVMSASVIGKGSQLVDAKGDVVGDGKSYDYLGTPANGLVAFREKYDSPCGYLDYQARWRSPPSSPVAAPSASRVGWPSSAWKMARRANTA